MEEIGISGKEDNMGKEGHRTLGGGGRTCLVMAGVEGV